jgi:4-diphosphocytidyl-2-C-methyl-D-erythritol kinase
LTPRSGSRAVELDARAKLNLYLHVLGRRPDGYHELDSLVVFAEFGDRLAFAPAAALSLELEGPFAEALDDGPGNLVLKAAHLLRERFRVEEGAAIRLEKRIPVAAGLGGGSADAAAALIGLARLWNLPASDRDLADLARKLGADVPACLAGRAVFAGGVGERLEPAPPLPELGVVLANPRIPLPTASVFAARSGPFSAPARWSGKTDAAGLADLLRDRRSDLTRPALALLPEIGAVLTALGDAPGILIARMSGSGATCFGLTGAVEEAKSAAESLRLRNPGWWVTASRILPDAALPDSAKVR